jgi:hypothetical protein
MLLIIIKNVGHLFQLIKMLRASKLSRKSSNTKPRLQGCLRGKAQDPKYKKSEYSDYF